MKVTVYTTSTCPFSKQEKEYLQSKNVDFEEKNLEVNRDFLNELLAVSDNFAGTPVTKVEQDNGQTVVLKGFTREEFDKVFAPTVQVAQAAQPQPEPPTPPAPTPSVPTPAPEPPVSNPIPPPPPAPEPAPEPVPTPVVSMPQADEPVTPQTPPPPQPEPTPPPVVEPPKAETPPQQEERNDALDAILKDLQNKVNQAYSTQQKPAAPSGPVPGDQPAPKPQTPPQPTPPTQTPPVVDPSAPVDSHVPDFPAK